MNNYKNHVIFQRIFKLKPNTRNINNEANRIYIKQYKYQVLNNDRKKQQLMDMDIIFDHLPISGYKFDLTDYENIEIFRNTANYTMNKLAPSEKLYSIQYLDSLTGCQHYVRGCEIECVTCKKFYICRFCHNDNEDHNLPRFETEHFRCIFCKFVQLPTQTCTNCNIQFGSYFCAKCKLVCDIGPEPKPNYHCDTCGCCMVGLQQYSKHCDTCGMCYSTKGFVSHKCRSDIGECIVCLDQLKHSIFGHIELKCGHLIHSHCHDELLYHMDYKCPICKKFTPQGEERRVVLREQRKLYKRVFFRADSGLVTCQCNDCGLKFVSKSHPYGQYCYKCRMFNVEELVDEGTEEAFVVYKQNCDLQPLDFDLESVIRFIGVLTNKNSQEDKLRYFRRNLGVPLNDATIFMIASLASKKIYYTIDQLMKDFGTLYYYATDGDIIEEDFEPDEYE